MIIAPGAWIRQPGFCVGGYVTALVGGLLILIAVAMIIGLVAASTEHEDIEL